MDSRLREEALLWIKEVATVVVEGTRKSDPDAAQTMERETSRYLRELRRLSEDVTSADM